MFQTMMSSNNNSQQQQYPSEISDEFCPSVTVSVSASESSALSAFYDDQSWILSPHHQDQDRHVLGSARFQPSPPNSYHPSDDETSFAYVVQPDVQQRSHQSGTNNNSSEIASIFSKPSAFLQRVLDQKAASGVSAGSYKRQRVHEAPSSSSCYPSSCYPSPASSSSASATLTHKNDSSNNNYLHRACRLSDISLEHIQHLLLLDPLAAGRPARLLLQSTSSESSSSTAACNTNSSTASELYSYPLNLAIFHQASPAVLKVLMQAAPQVLMTPDGPDQECSLQILWKYQSQSQQPSNTNSDSAAEGEGATRRQSTSVMLDMILLASSLSNGLPSSLR
jgi:hypothetical protein